MVSVLMFAQTGLQVTDPRRRLAGLALAVAAFGAAIALQSVRDRAYPREAAAEPGVPLRPVAGGAPADRAVVRRAGGRRLLDPRAAALRRRSAVARWTAAIRAAVSAARPHHLARSVLHDRLPVRGDLPERRLSRRTGTAGSGGRAAEQRHRRAAGRTGAITTTSPSSITGNSRTRRPRRCGSGRRRHSPAPRTGSSRWPRRC